LDDFYSCLFGTIIIAAIFGTSILRDFQRDTYQILFTKPISKFAYLAGRWAGSFVVTLFAFSGMLVGTFFGTFAPWADHARIGETTSGGISSRFCPSSSSRFSSWARCSL
jgi:ABC-2 type transport system permease protein